MPPGKEGKTHSQTLVSQTKIVTFSVFEGRITSRKAAGKGLVRYKTQVVRIRKSFISLCYNFKVNSSTGLRKAATFKREKKTLYQASECISFFTLYSVSHLFAQCYKHIDLSNIKAVKIVLHIGL